ncbi:MAG: hypothetical protein H6Q70_4024, partial [Firmicutes bacterium]|nr:hypothetical protein [Bacillota bacterium]
ESRDVASMLYCHKGEIKAFRRFLLDVRIDVQRLRDFKQMTAELISDCRVLSMMSVDLVDHMKRESEHFLMILTLIERGLVKHCPEVFQDDVESANWEDQERLDDKLEIEETDLADMLNESEDSSNLTGDERMELASKQQEEDLKASVDILSETAMETDNAADEPLIAVIEMESTENSRVSEVKEEKQVEVVLENQETVVKIEEKAEEKLEDTIPVEAVVPKEKIYAKASNYKYMPNKFAGKTPEEKLREKAQKEKTQNKIRRLGKK